MAITHTHRSVSRPTLPSDHSSNRILAFPLRMSANLRVGAELLSFVAPCSRSLSSLSLKQQVGFVGKVPIVNGLWSE